ncbi:hypothetical protein [Natrialba swarupiae]|uniref:Uncharacterized protein n=1 Tax=Natrialba swarupiae TaxID=2448032 RepID=A0A5D5APG6_9EURY|nr:hypothetical protein [Natrialba swarupiae]TYT61340.1 hypothetical protein FYC77_14115 [Natrialba swarupiae]
MLRALVSRAREWIAVDDPEDRIEGSGEPIMSPKNRRSPEAQRVLRESRDLEERHERRDEP